MLRGCMCTCVCMNLPDIGQNHSELPQNEIWVVGPRDYLILILNRVGALQQNFRECCQNPSS